MVRGTFDRFCFILSVEEHSTVSIAEWTPRHGPEHTSLWDSAQRQKILEELVQYRAAPMTPGEFTSVLPLEESISCDWWLGREELLRRVLAVYFTCQKLFQDFLDFRGIEPAAPRKTCSQVFMWAVKSHRFMWTLPALMYVPLELGVWLDEPIHDSRGESGNATLCAESSLPWLYEAVVRYCGFIDEYVDRVYTHTVAPGIRQMYYQ